jgi:hypothetical protein
MISAGAFAQLAAIPCRTDGLSVWYRVKFTIPIQFPRRTIFSSDSSRSSWALTSRAVKPVSSTIRFTAIS